MRYTLRIKGALLLTILIVHTALCSPVVKRDVIAALGAEDETALPVQHQLSLDDVDVFGGATMEGGSREKRLLKLKAIGLGAGLKAAGAGLKAVGAIGAKAVGKVAIKAATKVGAKVAKAAITLGIAKVLLSLVFGKIHQLLGFKTRLFGGNIGGHANVGGSTAGVSASADIGGDTGVTAQVGVNAAVNTDLPEIDPEKISLQVPDEFISGGFNVVNKAGPVVGDVIQNTAERLARLVGGLKPILRSSLGFKSIKRETQDSVNDDLAEASIVEPVQEDAPSQFRRNDVRSWQRHLSYH